MTEDEMVKSTLGDSEGQGSLACCGAWGCKDSEATQRLAPAATHPLALHSVPPPPRRHLLPPPAHCSSLLAAVNSEIGLN